MADPGFPRGGGANSPGAGRQHTILPNFPQKLHEIERIWTPRGGARPKFYFVDPPLLSLLLSLALAPGLLVAFRVGSGVGVESGEDH